MKEVWQQHLGRDHQVGLNEVPIDLLLPFEPVFSVLSLVSVR